VSAMHFEVLVEDQSGKTALEILLPKILDGRHTVEVHSYKGIGRIPKGLKATSDPRKRILLDRLPKLLSGFGEKFSSYPSDYLAAVIVVCDLDSRRLQPFLHELQACLDTCNPAPMTRFCIAIEEGEAWFFGDIPAIKRAYPKAKDKILNSYVNDSICGTWEQLADAITPGGAKKLLKQGWVAVGAEKSQWSAAITPHMDIESNKSPSFIHFRDKIRELTCASEKCLNLSHGHILASNGVLNQMIDTDLTIEINRECPVEKIIRAKN